MLTFVKKNSKFICISLLIMINTYRGFQNGINQKKIIEELNKIKQKLNFKNQLLLKMNIIVAQSTPIGRGALAIIRLSGKNVRQLLEEGIQLKSKKKIQDIASHTVHYGYIKDRNQNIIDQVIITIMDAPRSFTGENTAEITCHCNQFIIKNIINRCIELGACLAKPGEFTERAVLNKKMDLFQAEAINELLHAQNETITKIAMAQLEGSLSNEITKIDDELTIISAWCQASFEFLDEERDFRTTILEKVEKVISQIEKLLHIHQYSTIIKNGIRISIIGSVNVGKSSLMNTLLGYKRAIVSNIEGTTRDTIEAQMTINNHNVTFIDTAGIRETNNKIEKEGIEKSYEEIEKSDIILVIYSQEILSNKNILNFYTNIIEKNKNKSIIIENKIDTKNYNKNILIPNSIPISVLQKIGIQEIYIAISKKINEKYNTESLSFIINARHNENLEYVLKEINIIKKMLQSHNPFYEIILHHLLESQKKISDLTGKSIEEKSLDKVFREFCVGK